jgi:peptidoglycan/LPS O-acetylase OafA/YrhL
MIVRSPAGRAFLERRRRALASAACGLGAGLLALIPLRQVDLTGSVVMCTVGYSALAAFYALVLLLAVSRPSSPVARCLRAGWLRSTGEIAYGMYMLHEVVLGLCFAFFLRAAPVVTNRVEFMVVPLAAMLTVAVARLSWTHFESKMLRFGRRRSDTVPPEPVAVDRPTPSVPSLALIPSVEGVAPSGPK